MFCSIMPILKEPCQPRFLGVNQLYIVTWFFPTFRPALNITNKMTGSSVEDTDTVDRVEMSEKGARDSTESTSKNKYGYHFQGDRSLWIKFKLPLLGEIRFNPIVSTAAIAVIWAFVAICSVYRESVPFGEWRSWIVANFTWLYIGSQDIWAVFAIVLYCSKYSNIKLGKDTDVPEYSDPTWFMMLFACGIGVGLFFFGVAEPIFHYIGPNRYTTDPTMPDNTVAQVAMNLTLYHWGIHGWIVYSLVGLLLALLSYR